MKPSNKFTVRFKVFLVVGLFIFLKITVLCAQKTVGYGITVAGASTLRLKCDSNHIWGAADVIVDKSGNVYVADALENRIMKWAHGATYGVLIAGQYDGSTASDSLHLRQPTGIFIDIHGQLYICDQNNNRVVKWWDQGKYFITVAGQKNCVAGSDSMHLNNPHKIFVDSADNIYVADSKNNRIQRWGPSATYGVTVAGQKDGGSGKDSTHFYNPKDVYVDRVGNLFVLDGGNNRVEKWASGAGYGITVAGHKDCSYGYDDSTGFYYPEGMFIDKKGSIYVADADNNRIQKWMPGAKYGITVAGAKDCSTGNDSLHLNWPRDVYVDSIGNIYVADYSNSRIQKWASIANNIKDIKVSLVGEFNIYPNPNDGRFTITLENLSQNSKVQIVNILGQIVYENIMNDVSGKSQLEINNILSSGIYLIRVTQNGISQVARMVVTR